ncbi:MAG: PqqD family peptide modification chaperone [Pseudonocardiaceae bacterium]
MPSYLPCGSVHLTPTPSGALVILDTRSGRMFQVNSTGATAWNALVVGGGEVQVAARTVAQRYGQPYLQVLDDLWSLIHLLVEANLLEAIR